MEIVLYKESLRGPGVALTNVLWALLRARPATHRTGECSRVASRYKLRQCRTPSLGLRGVLFEYKTLFRPLKPNFGYHLSPINFLGMDFRVVALHRFLG